MKICFSIADTFQTPDTFKTPSRHPQDTLRPPNTIQTPSRHNPNTCQTPSKFSVEPFLLLSEKQIWSVVVITFVVTGVKQSQPHLLPTELGLQVQSGVWQEVRMPGWHPGNVSASPCSGESYADSQMTSSGVWPACGAALRSENKDWKRIKKKTGAELGQAQNKLLLT